MLTLTTEQRLAAHFTILDTEDVQALAFLKLIDKYSTETDVKELSFILDYDGVVSARRMDSWTAAQDEARAKNPDPEYSDPEAWFHIGDDEFTALDVVQAMTDDERKELRARVLAVRR